MEEKWHQRKWFIILLCIFAPYIGIFLLWKRTKSKGLRALVSAWAVIALFVIFSDPEKTSQTTAPETNQIQTVDTAVKAEQDKKKAEEEAKAQAEAEAKAKAEAEAKAKTDVEAKKPENAAKTAVHKAFGETNSYDKKDSILELNFNKDNGFLLIRVFAQDNFSEKMIKQGMWMDAYDVLKALNDNKEIKTVAFNIVLPLQDAYGKTSNDNVMKMEFGSETRGKIVWENFSWSGIPKVAENYWEHPVIRKIQTN
jgi:uncharacterized protein YgiB involved in biofilm formation